MGGGRENNFGNLPIRLIFLKEGRRSQVEEGVQSGDYGKEKPLVIGGIPAGTRGIQSGEENSARDTRGKKL